MDSKGEQESVEVKITTCKWTKNAECSVVSSLAWIMPHVIPVILFNMSEWAGVVELCESVPVLIKGSLNPLPAPATLHFRMTLSSGQWRSCCPRLLLLKANRTRTGPFVPRLHVFCPGYWCHTLSSDVTFAVALKSGWCRTHSRSCETPFFPSLWTSNEGLLFMYLGWLFHYSILPHGCCLTDEWFFVAVLQFSELYESSPWRPYYRRSGIVAFR